ncbi:dephospho-CoA kinase [Bowmanella yangjiangensis]|uniref:Dephospho-CoA kinase n=1 Tax=Bowmanella yangjiangensis TaxID=2811230 RepID=A0ABS3CMB6_9ALTE|nr:dephospho-CoA kinase [Bowmanella yangjiangensis]
MTGHRPLVIGLTGGIGSGKTKVSDLFADLGIDIVDADLLAREVVEPGTPALKEITEHFGAEILQADGQLDRRALRERIFANPQEKSWLNSLLHPLIRQLMQTRSRQAKSPYCILAIPLLVENQLHQLVDRILVVDVKESIQCSRVVARDQVSEAQAEAILASQASRQQRLAAADDIIDNSGQVEALIPQVNKLHQQYLTLANSLKA